MRIYTYTIHYAYAYYYNQYVLSEKGDRQQLLTAQLKLAKLPRSETKTNYLFESFIPMRAT